MRYLRRHRLTNAQEYKLVFDARQRSVDELFLIYWKRNEYSFPRLGMAIAKKKLKLSSSRNTVKRIVRESFRANIENLAGLDVIVLLNRPLVDINKAQLTQALNRHWGKIT